MLSDLGASILSAFPGQTVSLLRSNSAISFSGGIVQSPSQTTTTIKVVAQEATPDQIMQLPQGEQVKSAVSIFSRTLLLISDETAGTIADQIVYNGRTYTILKVENWIAQYGYCRALASRCDP